MSARDCVDRLLSDCKNGFIREDLANKAATGTNNDDNKDVKKKRKKKEKKTKKKKSKRTTGRKRHIE